MTVIALGAFAIAGLIVLAVMVGRAQQSAQTAQQSEKLATEVARDVAQTTANLAGLSDDQLRERLRSQSHLERLPVGAANQGASVGHELLVGPSDASNHPA